MACIEMDDKKIQKDVASAAGTTEVTLRNRLKGLEETLRPVMEMGDAAIINATTQ
jgi:transcription initiation factor TFIIB